MKATRQYSRCSIYQQLSTASTTTQCFSDKNVLRFRRRGDQPFLFIYSTVACRMSVCSLLFAVRVAFWCATWTGFRADSLSPPYRQPSANSASTSTSSVDVPPTPARTSLFTLTNSAIACPLAFTRHQRGWQPMLKCSKLNQWGAVVCNHNVATWCC